MAKATTTIRQSLNYQPQYAHYFAENAALFNRVVSFYFDCIQAHAGILALTNQEALTALERLTHATEHNPAPIMPLGEIAPNIPAMYRRAAINAAIGSARSFFSPVAPAMRITMASTKAPRAPTVSAWDISSMEGTRPRPTSTWATAMLSSDQHSTGRHKNAPHVCSSCSATKA